MIKSDQEKILGIIEKRNKNSILGHFYSFFVGEVLEADISANTIYLWKSTYPNGFLHPVFKLDFNQGTLLKVSVKLNPIGRIFNLILLSLYLFLSYSFLIEETKDNVKFMIGLIAILTGLFFYLWAINKLTQIFRQRLLLRIEETIGKPFFLKE